MNTTSSVSEILTNTNSRLSTIDKVNNITSRLSTIDYLTNKLRLKLKDPNLGSGFVALAYAKLGEAELINISDYAVRKANHPGKVFVKICNNTMVKKGLK